MGLQIWIPCDGRNNLGLTGKIPFVRGSGVAYADGKTGQCLSYNGNGSNIGSIDYTLGNAATMACWVYYTNRPASGNNDWCFQLGTSSGLANTVLGIATYPDNISIGIGGLYHHYSYTLSTGVWYHLAVTWDGSVATFYINGTKQAEFTDLNTGTKKVATAMALGSNVANSDTRLRGKLNDVRVYDCCLSPYEVKELSKALVLHYKLDENYQTMENVFSYPTFNTSSASGGWLHWAYTNNTGTNSQNTDRTYIYRDSQTYSHYIEHTSGDNYYLCYQSPAFDGGYRSAQAIIKMPNGEDPHGHVYFTANATVGTKPPTTFTQLENGFWLMKIEGLQQDGSDDLFGIYLRHNKGLYISEAYLEDNKTVCSDIFGSHTTVSDGSGYGNNGTVHGNIVTTYDTKRFDTCAVFDSSSYIAAGQGAKVKDQITVAGWVKPSAWTSSMGNFISCTENGGFNFETYGNGKLRFVVGTGTSSNTYKLVAFQTPLSQFSAGWHHLAGTYDGYTLKVYLDGVLNGSTAAYTTKTPIFYNSSNGIFLAAEAAGGTVTTDISIVYSGSLSDIRIYATALSSEDIMDLYHTSAIVDNAGSLHSFQLKEKSANILTIEKINKWATSSSAHTYYTTRNGVLSFPIQPNWYPSTSPSYSTLRNEFKENTSYVIDMWIDADSVVYDNVNRPAGFIIVYSDGTTKDLTVKGNAQSPVRWQHVLYVTPSDKTISHLRVFYYVSDAFWVRADSFITEAGSTDIEADGTTSSGQFIENTDTAFIGKGDFNARKFIEI